MKAHNNTMMIQVIALMTAMLLSGAAPVLASQHEGEKTSAAEVKAEAAETYQAMKQYTLEQRDEAMAVAKENLAQLDNRIDEMQAKIDERWQNMSKATREKTRHTLNALRQQREEVAEWYGGMRHSSADTWENVKKGFSDSYDRLKKAFQESSEDIESEQ